MGYPLSIRLQHIPRSLTAPDAWLAILLAAFLQLRQYRRRRRHQNENSGKFHIHKIGTKSKPKFNGIWTLTHQWLFTSLRMFVSPLPDQASELNAGVIDMQSDKELTELAKEVASSTGHRAPKKKLTKNSTVRKTNTSREVEVRSRRILKGELVHDIYYPLVETTVNLSLAVLVGISSRWIFGLLRSLSLSGRGGPCCSPYTGGEDDLPGSFERLLACVLIKKEGDDAGNFLFTLLLAIYAMNAVQLAWSVSSLSSSKHFDVNDDSGSNNGDGGGARIGSKSDEQIYMHVHPQKIRRVLVGCGAGLASLWLFHTPALLRFLGLDGLPEAIHELSARILLFVHLFGIASPPRSGSFGDVQTLVNICFALIALAWGYLASAMMIPIEETARNAAHIMSPSTAKKSLNPSETMDLINVRMMLIIQAVTPVLILCTYFLNNHFEDSLNSSAGGRHRKMSFSKQYLQNSGLYVRIVLAWCFLAACAYCLRSLLQSYLDQATSVASATGMLGEGVAQDVASDRRGSSQTFSRETDPFNDRYKNIVLTSGRIAAFPAMMLALLALAHIRGGDGTPHPGVGYQSQQLNAPRSSLDTHRLLPSYSNRYMSWTFRKKQQLRGDADVRAGDGLLLAAAFSLPEINESPFRDSAHSTIVSWLGSNRLCSPPEVRSVNSLIRNVQFILDETYGEAIGAITAMTGRELLELAPEIPVTLLNAMMGSEAQGSCVRGNDPGDTHSNEVCESSIGSSSPSLFEIFVSAMSHQLFTPTVVFPLVDAFAFLSCVWWSYWYSFKFVIYSFKLRKLMTK